MRIAYLSLLAVVFSASVAWAQTVDPAIQQAVDARGVARIENNGEEWARHVTDDFVWVGPMEA